MEILGIDINITLNLRFKTKEKCVKAKKIVDYEYVCKFHNVDDKHGDLIHNYIASKTTPKFYKLIPLNEKIVLQRSWLHGCEDVYALRWINIKNRKSGYSLVCANKCVSGICDMTKAKCAKCTNIEGTSN